MLDRTRGSNRLVLPTERTEDQRAIETMRAAGVLVIDDSRRRPRYFDGRFLTARDLTREQNYFLARQSDIGRAGGAGVVTGLGVDMTVPRDRDAAALVISPGHGITASGELVLLTEQITISLENIPELDQLNVRLGLSRLPQPPQRTAPASSLWRCARWNLPPTRSRRTPRRSPAPAAPKTATSSRPPPSP